jgi:hypothetical protein
MFRVSRTITQYSIDVVREASARSVNHGENLLNILNFLNILNIIRMLSFDPVSCHCPVAWDH